VALVVNGNLYFNFSRYTGETEIVGHINTRGLSYGHLMFNINRRR